MVLLITLLLQTLDPASVIARHALLRCISQPHPCTCKDHAWQVAAAAAAAAATCTAHAAVPSPPSPLHLLLRRVYQAAGKTTCLSRAASHLLGKVTSALRGVEDLVVEYGEVKGKAQTDGVSGGQVDQGNVLQHRARLS